MKEIGGASGGVSKSYVDQGLSTKLENINNESINDLSDVDLTGIKNGDILKYNGGNFYPVTTSFASSFVKTDWIGPNSGFYTLPITHNLNNLLVNVEVWDNLKQEVTVERLLTSVNVITLRVPAIPDCCFAGYIWIRGNI